MTNSELPARQLLWLRWSAHYLRPTLEPWERKWLESLNQSYQSLSRKRCFIEFVRNKLRCTGSKTYPPYNPYIIFVTIPHGNPCSQDSKPVGHRSPSECSMPGCCLQVAQGARKLCSVPNSPEDLSGQCAKSGTASMGHSNFALRSVFHAWQLRRSPEVAIEAGRFASLQVVSCLRPASMNNCELKLVRCQCILTKQGLINVVSCLSQQLEETNAAKADCKC